MLYPVRSVLRGMAILCLVVAQACAGDTGGGTDNGAPTWAEAANAVYPGIYESPVQLTEGEYVGKPFADGAAARPRIGLVPAFRLDGDLVEGEPREAVVLLWENSGGTGTFTYLAVLARTPGGVETLGVARVGDRVQIRSAGIHDRAIVLDVVQGGPLHAACCPGQKASRTRRVGAQGLTELAPFDGGRMSLADLAGQDWVLRSFGEDDLAPGVPAITVGFEDGRVAGYSGCNTYFASIEAGEAPGAVTVGPVGMTMMACDEDAMALEQRFHRALGTVESYAFVAGRLALTSFVDGEVTTLFFDGSQPALD